MISTGAFPGCCGAQIAYAFPSVPYLNGEEAVKKFVDKEVNRLVSNARNHPGITLCILTPEQQKYWDEAIHEAGFKRVVRGFFNKNHGSNLTLYMFEAYPDNRKKVFNTKTKEIDHVET